MDDFTIGKTLGDCQAQIAVLRADLEAIHKILGRDAFKDLIEEDDEV